MPQLETRGLILAGGKGSRMGSDLPKVMHEIHGQPMLLYGIHALEQADVDQVVVVVGFRHQRVESSVDLPGIRFVVQAEQLGTGHAVLQAEAALDGFDGLVFVVYGDMPMLKPSTLKALRQQILEHEADAALLTLTMPHPPEWGRIVRDEHGQVVRIVEVADASPETLAIDEVNVGVYCFRAPLLFEALHEVTNHNNQHEYYLTDVVDILTRQGRRVVTSATDDLDEVMGVNQPFQLRYCEKLLHIEHAESLYALIDAVAAMRHGLHPPVDSSRRP